MTKTYSIEYQGWETSGLILICRLKTSILSMKFHFLHLCTRLSFTAGLRSLVDKRVDS